MHLELEPREYYGNGAKMLLLKSPGRDQNTMYTDTTYLDQSVKVTGIYPAQEMFCEALTCECEDYILVSDVTLNAQD